MEAERVEVEGIEAVGAEGGGRAPGGLLDLVLRTTDLVVPRVCACGIEGTVLCAACAAALAGPPRRVEAACAALQTLVRADAERGETDFASVLPVLALGAHAGALRRQVLAFKNGGQYVLAAPFARALAPGLASLGMTDAQRTALVPVPSSRAHRLRRGEDHTALLTARLARGTAGSPVRALGMSQGSQAGKAGRERRRERAGQLRLRRGARRALAGRDVILIDDVVTTGATLRAACETLRAEGIAVRGALVLASARLPPPDTAVPSLGGE